MEEILVKSIQNAPALAFVALLAILMVKFVMPRVLDAMQHQTDVIQQTAREQRDTNKELAKAVKNHSVVLTYHVAKTQTSEAVPDDNADFKELVQLLKNGNGRGSA